MDGRGSTGRIRGEVWFGVAVNVLTPRYGCVTGDNAGFFKIDGCSKCVGGMAECLNTDAVMEYTRVYPESVAGDGEYFHFRLKLD